MFSSYSYYNNTNTLSPKSDDEDTVYIEDNQDTKLHDISTTQQGYVLTKNHKPYIIYKDLSIARNEMLNIASEYRDNQHQDFETRINILSNDKIQVSRYLDFVLFTSETQMVVFEIFECLLDNSAGKQ